MTIPTKEFKNLDEQVQVLKERNLHISDDVYAKKMLLNKNYFDLINGFESLFFDSLGNTSKDYQNQFDFNHILALYDFEKDLASRIFKAIDVFEIRLKTSLAYRFSETIFSNSEPDNYMDIMKYENALSVSNRIQWAVTLGTATQDFINNIDKDIGFKNIEIQKINSKLSSTYNPYNINYVSRKSRKALQKIETQIQSSLTTLNNEIISTNALANRSGFTVSSSPLKSLSSISSSFSLNLIQVPSSASNSTQIGNSVQDHIKDLQNFNRRVNKVTSAIKLNPNRAIYTVPENQLKNLENHPLFRTNYKSQNHRNLNYIEFCKSSYKYINTYQIPPLWVIVKTFELGAILQLLYSVEEDILDNIMRDLNFPISEKEAFFNSLEIIRIFRNHTAHFQLVNRFRTPPHLKINTYLITTLGLKTKNNGATDYEIKLYDTLVILNQFTSLNEIQSLFKEFFTNDISNLNHQVLIELLKRMGNESLLKWYNFKT